MGCILGMLILNGLPRLYHPTFKSENFKKFSDNGFFVTIETKDPLFKNVEATRSFLQSIGARNIEVLED